MTTFQLHDIVHLKHDYTTIDGHHLVKGEPGKIVHVYQDSNDCDPVYLVEFQKDKNIVASLNQSSLM